MLPVAALCLTHIPTPPTNRTIHFNHEIRQRVKQLHVTFDMWQSVSHITPFVYFNRVTMCYSVAFAIKVCELLQHMNTWYLCVVRMSPNFNRGFLHYFYTLLAIKNWRLKGSRISLKLRPCSTVPRWNWAQLYVKYRTEVNFGDSVEIHKSFLCDIWGCGISWKFYPWESYAFSTNLWKFSPSKVLHHTVILLPLLTCRCS